MSIETYAPTESPAAIVGPIAPMDGPGCARDKQRHPTPESAEAQIRSLEQRDRERGILAPEGSGLRVVYCGQCRAFHVGHPRSAAERVAALVVPAADGVIPVGFSRLRDEILARYTPPNRAPGTRREVEHVLRLMAEAGMKSTADFTETYVARYLTTRPGALSSYTLRKELRILRTISNYCLKMRWIAISPFYFKPVSEFVRLGKPIRKRRHYSREEIRAILELMASDVRDSTGWVQWRARRLYALTATVAFTGIRASEAFWLQVEDVDLDHGAIMIESRLEHKTKTAASAAPVATPPPLIPILRDWILHRSDCPPNFLARFRKTPWLFPGVNRIGPWVQGAPGTKPADRLKVVAARAGVEGVNFLGLRHSWSTHAEHFGINGHMIKRQLRHTTERTSEEFYRHPDLPNLREATRNFEY